MAEPGGIVLWQTHIDGFLTALAGAGRARGTLRLRAHHLGRLRQVAPSPLEVTTADLEQWLSQFDWEPETRRSIQTSARTFFGWLERRGVITTNPALGLLPVALPRALPRPAPDRAFFDAMMQAEYRVKLMLASARFLGLRCVEIAPMHSANLIGEMYLVKGKGGHERMVPILNAELRAAIANANGYLFPSERGGHVSAAWVSKMISRALPEGWTAHTLRHAFATTSFRENPDLLSLAEVLGHAKLDTTRRYTQLAEPQLRKVVEAGAPPTAPRISVATWERPRRSTIYDRHRNPKVA